jgi:serine/threonine protein kinase
MTSPIDEPPAHQRLGDFEIVRELGRGGMGIVYEARQVSLNRKVALKILSGFGLSARAVPRFNREAEAAAKLHHTNIVPVYATGDENGTHFYAMELIEGPALDAVIRQLRQNQTDTAQAPSVCPQEVTGPYVERPIPSTGSSVNLTSSSLGSDSHYFDTVAKLIADVADALDYAHKQGVIHRDIKPSNLLQSPDGRLSINDFGLARMLEEPGMTMTGEFVGTPAYMSPEQITAGRVPINHRTDIYSLGATLYELLTLERPFSGERRDQLLAQILQKDPVAPRRINRKVPIDLETICLKAIDKDPDRRYQTAGDLASDLQRYVNRFAISARRAGPIEPLSKWIKRNPALSAAALVVLFALSAAGVFAWQARESERRRWADEHQRQEEAIAEKRRSAMERGMVAAMAADLPGAEKAVEEAELLGASAGETRMLRGFIASHSGQAAEAVRHLEQAVQLLPNRVAPRALLAVAYYEQGNPAFRQMVADIEAMTALTPEDTLFKGSAVAIEHPADGLRLMNESLASHPSTLGHLLRADAQLYFAQVTGTVAAAEDAVAAAAFAKQLLPDNPWRLGKSGSAHLSAMTAHERAGDTAKAAEHLAAAKREAEGLVRFGSNPMAILYRYDVAAVVDGLEGKLDYTAELRAARAGPRDFIMTFYEADNWLCLGNDQEADFVASELSGIFTGCVRALAALGQPGGRAAAIKALEVFTVSDSPWRHRFTLAPILFAVDRARCKAMLKDLSRESDPLTYSDDLDERKRIISMYDGTISEVELLAAPARGPVDLCARHFNIAWKRLADGDREGARKAFEEAYRFKLVDYITWTTSRIVLIRMKDPNWPQALLEKE